MPEKHDIAQSECTDHKRVDLEPVNHEHELCSGYSTPQRYYDSEMLSSVKYTQTKQDCMESGYFDL